MSDRQQLFGRAMIVLKALNLAVDWELAPSIKEEIADICAEFEAGEPSSAPPAAPKPKVGGAYTGLRNGCTAHPSGFCECGVEESHKLCVCADCGSTWSNPEWRSGAAQEVSPAK